MHPSLQPVSSSNIAGVGYHVNTQTMVVMFHSGAYYAYSSVPPEVIEQFHASISKGSFLNSRIKSGGFPVRQIVDEEITTIFLFGRSAVSAAASTASEARRVSLVQLGDLMEQYAFLRFSF